MRCLFLFASALVVLSGCSQSENPVTSDTVQSGTLQFTLAIPKATLGVHDTLQATVVAKNVGTTADTIADGVSLFSWTLQNESGETIMFGGGGNWVIISLPIQPGQSQTIYQVKQVIADTSGKAVVPGPYTLKATVRVPQTSFLVNLSIR